MNVTQARGDNKITSTNDEYRQVRISKLQRKKWVPLPIAVSLRSRMKLLCFSSSMARAFRLLDAR